jgi:chaperonin cofactor prefoldin
MLGEMFAGFAAGAIITSWIRDVFEDKLEKENDELCLELQRFEWKLREIQDKLNIHEGKLKNKLNDLKNGK